MNPMILGAYGLIGWGIYKLAFKKSPLSTQATPVIPPIIKPTTPAAQSAAVASSANVAAIQARLNVLGASPQLVVDGISGPKTIAAIQAFQRANNITPDGIVGPITQAALDQGGAAPTPTTPGFVPSVQQAISSYPQQPTVVPAITQVNTWADEPEQALVDHF